MIKNRIIKDYYWNSNQFLKIDISGHLARLKNKNPTRKWVCYFYISLHLSES